MSCSRLQLFNNAVELHFVRPAGNQLRYSGILCLEAPLVPPLPPPSAGLLCFFVCALFNTHVCDCRQVHSGLRPSGLWLTESWVPRLKRLLCARTRRWQRCAPCGKDWGRELLSCAQRCAPEWPVAAPPLVSHGPSVEATSVYKDTGPLAEPFMAEPLELSY